MCENREKARRILMCGTTKELAEKLDILVEPSVPDRKC